MTNVKMLAIGTATQDVFLQGGSVFKPKKEADGESYEHLPLGAKLGVENVVFATGGNALNAATTFARQGLDSYFMGILGVEPAGEVVMRALDVEGIDSRYVSQEEMYRTSYSTILLAPNGERTILNYHGSQLRSDGLDINLEAIAKMEWLYLSSVGSLTLLEKIITTAAKNKVKVAINPSPRELEQASKLRPLLEDVDVLITNKEEMKEIVEGISAEELIRHAANLVKTVVISDGPRGVIATDGQKLVKAGVYSDVKVVDRTGAGDAFGSGFVSVLAQNGDIERAVTLASANATSVVGKIGATAGILHRGARLHDMSLKVEDF